MKRTQRERINVAREKIELLRNELNRAENLLVQAESGDKKDVEVSLSQAESIVEAIAK